MARVFIGDSSKVDPDVLAAVHSLPDDFWVLGEFTLRRNYDWFILRPFDNAPAALILAEVKRQSRPLRGTINAPWEEALEGGEWEAIRPANQSDRNFYWQAVNAANSLSEWLHNNEPVFNDTLQGVWTEVRVWPDLLILSPPGTTHALPLRPDSGFGSWFFDLDRWINHLLTWRPRLGPRLGHADIHKLVQHLGVQPGGELPPPPIVPRANGAEPAPSAPQELARLSQLVDDLALRVAHLEHTLYRTSRMLATGAAAWGAGGPGHRELRPLSEAEREAITTAVRHAAQKGYVPTYPSVLKELETVLSEDLKSSNYRGYGTASALFQQAALEGVIQLGRKRGPSPTIWLPGEAPSDD